MKDFTELSMEEKEKLYNSVNAIMAKHCPEWLELNDKLCNYAKNLFSSFSGLEDDEASRNKLIAYACSTASVFYETILGSAALFKAFDTRSSAQGRMYLRVVHEHMSQKLLTNYDKDISQMIMKVEGDDPGNATTH